jgi:hypothetical protein
MIEIASTQLIIEAFTLLSDGSRAAASTAKQNYSSVDKWRTSQGWQTATVGAVASIIPGIHLPAGVAETLYLLYKMAWCAWGIGGLRNCEVEGKDDLQFILGLWSHAISESQIREMFDLCRKAAILKEAYENNPQIKKALVSGATVGQVTATVSTAGIPVTLAALSHAAVGSVTFGQLVAATSQAIPHVASMAIAGIPHAVSIVASKGVAKVAVMAAIEMAPEAIAPLAGASWIANTLIANELVAHHFASPLGVTIQQHTSAFITKVAQKAAAKITKKSASKFVVGFVPFVGALAVAGINAWILQGFADSADTYYRLKAEAAQN